MKDPKAIRKAIMTAKSIAAMVDPHFARVPLPDFGGPAPDMAMPEPQQFAAGGVTAGRSPKLQSYAQNIGTPDFDQERYNSLIDQHKPVRPYESVPVPATEEDMLRGLTANKHHKINAVDGYQEGHPVGLRLDIPAYTKHQVWVPTMHDLLQGGKPFSHQGAAHITDATFGMPESQASAVAKGRAKSPFARIDGHLKKTPVDDIHEMAKAALDSPEWVQVGMDPERHSYFYDRSDHRKPIQRADEVLQVGPLVLAKNPVFGDPRDHAYEDGGRVGYADGGMPDDERQANLDAFLEGNHPAVPRVVYHGTDRNISEFDTEKPRRIDVGMDEGHTDTGWYGKGHYFTPHTQAASYFASNYRVGEGSGPNVMPVHLSLKNPFIVKVPQSSSGALEMDQAMNAAGFPKTSDERLIRKGKGERLPSEQTQMLMDAGHDGVIVMQQSGIKNPEEEKLANERKDAAWKRHSAAQNAYYNAPMANRDNYAEIKPILQKLEEEYLNSRREYQAAREASGGEYRPHELVVFKPHQVKSAIGNSGRYDPNEPHIGRATGGEVDAPDYAAPDNLGLYSHAAATAASLPQAKASPAEFRGMLANRGVKPAEFEESGYDQAFADQPQVTREQVAAHFHENRTPIVEKSFRTNVPESEMEAFREKHINPLNDVSIRLTEAHAEARNNGINLRDNPTEEYRQLSDEYRRIREGYEKARENLYGKKPYHERWTLPGGENYREILLKHGGDDTLFKGPIAHFKGEPNILAHLLMSDRTDEEGKRVLHLDELQSDWAQQGRKQGFIGKGESSYEDYVADLTERFNRDAPSYFYDQGYNDEEIASSMRIYPTDPASMAGILGETSRHNALMGKISAGPYVTNTNDWVDLGLKRALMEAAKGGHDKLVWTPGQTAADRYDLSKHVTAIHHEKNEDGTYNLLAIDRNGSKVYGDRGVPEGKLEETFGKEVAGKIASGEGVGRKEAQAKVDAAQKEYEDFKDRVVEDSLQKRLAQYRELFPKFPVSEEEIRQMRDGLKQRMERDMYSHAQNHGFGEEHDTLHGNLMDARHAMNQIPNAPGSNWRSLSGLALKVGGEGMKKFYDDIVPKRLMALAKKHDPEAKFSTSTVRHPESHDDNEGRDSYTDLHALEITPRMRESILKKGFVARASGGEVDGYADGGVVGGYQDPETRYISDWNWRPVEDVQESLGNLKEIPSHVEKFGDFMDNIAKRAGGSGLTVRDLIKAYTITRSSIQRQAADVNKLRASGLVLPEDMTGKIRPEGAFGEWLHTPAGQAYLDAAEKGKIHQTAIQNAVKVMAPFGRHQTDIPDALTWAALNLPGKEKQVSELVHAGHLMASTPAEWREFTQNIRGVGPSKSGFLASLMGRGDQPTLDARQIILHTGRPTKEAGKYIAKKGGAGGVEAVDRLSARQSAMDLSLPDRLKPYYQHLTHHAVWDKAGGDETTHEDVVRAMHHAANGGFQTADDDPNVLAHPVAQTILAAAHGGDVLDNELFQKYLKRIHSPLSNDPNSVQKALEIAQSYRHKTGAETGTGSLYSIKQSVPASSVTRTIGNIPGVNLKPIKQGTWEDFYNTAKGAEFVNVGGDLSGFGRLTHINGKPLAWPVDLHAGADYMREPNPKRVWANIQAHATSYKNKILDAQERGKDLYGIFSPMGPSAVNSSHNMFDTLMAQIPNAGISPEHIKEFNEAIKRGDHLASIKKNKPGLFNEYIEKLEKWPGLENAKEASDFARPETGNINGGHRTKIVEFMDKGYWRDRGFPEVGVTRAAITNPDLLGAGGNKLGFRAIKLSANEPSGSKKIFKHSTYPVDTFGEYVMDLPLVQRHYAQPDVIDRLVMSPAKGGQIVHPYSEDPMGRSTARKMFEEQKQVQPVNQRFLDSVMTGMENQQKYGFNKGGKVRSALMIAKGLKKS